MQTENGIMNITQENKELLFKDLSARLHYGVKVTTTNPAVEFGVISGISIEYKISVRTKHADIVFDCAEVKPYLRPMSSMTDEEKKEYYKLCIAKFIKAGPGYTYDGWWEYYDTTVSIDWATKKMFDYRGLINKELALEAPKEMYNS